MVQIQIKFTFSVKDHFSSIRFQATKSSIHITCAVFSNNGQEIIATYSDEDIFLFHTFDTGDDVEYVKRYQGHCNSQTGNVEHRNYDLPISNSNFDFKWNIFFAIFLVAFLLTNAVVLGWSEYLSLAVKGVNFYGPNCEFVVSGSDCGNIFFWDKEGEDIVHMVKGDENGVVNCLEPHPNLPMLATSGKKSLTI